MKRTLYLHIGAQRTATSSLQQYLHSNLQPPSGRGVIYPFGVVRHQALMRDIFAGTRPIADVAAAMNAQADKSIHKVHSFVLSDEAICKQRDLSRLAEFGKWFDVKVVFCLRRQDLWLESWYLQNIKWQWDPAYCHLTLPEFLARRGDFFWIDYDTSVGHLEAVFGAENTLLPVYEKAQMPAGPVAAFCDLIGLRDRAGFTPEPQANASFAPLVSEFMRQLPLDEAPDAYRAVLERACRGVSAALPEQAQGARLLLGAAERRAILAEYAVGNQAVAQRRFGRKTLFSDPLPPPGAPVADLRLPGDSATVMRDLVVPFVRQLIAQHRPRDQGKP